MGDPACQGGHLPSVSEPDNTTAADSASEEVTSRILTAPNVISFVRLCMIPVFFVLLAQGNDVAACVVFAVAAGTDFLDGQLARRTNCVSKLGQVLDPAVDRLLMISGVLGVFLTGRVPVWVIVFVVARDLFLLIGGGILIRKYRIRVPVVFAGKVATTLLFIGFAALLLNMPVFEGLGIVEVSWLPGLCSGPYGWGIWFIYAGLILSTGVTVYYIVVAWRALQAALNERQALR